MPIPAKEVKIGADAKKPILLTASPRERFQHFSDNIGQHQKMVDLPAFDRGADAAMNQFTNMICAEASDPNNSMRVGYMIRGAQEFLRMFKSMGEIAVPRLRPSNPDHLQSTDQPRRQ